MLTNGQLAMSLPGPAAFPASVRVLNAHRCCERRADPPGNHLLQALDEGARGSWASLMEPVDLPQGQVLYAAGTKMLHVYFLTTATASLVTDMENGHSSEVAVIGNEGMVGTWALMGGTANNIRAVVQSAGRGLRMRASDAQLRFNRGGLAMLELLRYTQALITQISQNAACNRHHMLERRLCRWLLLSLDRHSTNEFEMTHEMIANTLGVRREGVTAILGRLQSSGLIKVRRGHLTVLDRKGVEQLSCECYGVIKREYDRLLPAEAA